MQPATWVKTFWVPLVMAFLFSCGNNGNGNRTGNTSMDSANALNRAKFSESQPALNQAQLLMTFYANRLYEMKASRAVLQQSHNASVKELADTVLQQDKRVTTSLDSLAVSKRISLPGDLSDSQRSRLDRLEQDRGNTFDADYIRQTVQSHKNDLALLIQAQQGQSSDSDVARWAGRIIPQMEHTVDLLTTHMQKNDTLQVKQGFQ